MAPGVARREFKKASLPCTSQNVAAAAVTFSVWKKTNCFSRIDRFLGYHETTKRFYNSTITFSCLFLLTHRHRL